MLFVTFPHFHVLHRIQNKFLWFPGQLSLFLWDFSSRDCRRLVTSVAKSLYAFAWQQETIRRRNSWIQSINQSVHPSIRRMDHSRWCLQEKLFLYQCAIWISNHNWLAGIAGFANSDVQGDRTWYQTKELNKKYRRNETNIERIKRWPQHIFEHNSF